MTFNINMAWRILYICKRPIIDYRLNQGTFGHTVFC